MTTNTTSVALFWDPLKEFDSWGNNTVNYSGQKKISKMDYLFEQPRTSFYVFKKHNKRGWEFVGKAVSNRRIRDRILNKQDKIYQTPRWEMTFAPSCQFTDTITEAINIYHRNAPEVTYLTKDVLLHIILNVNRVSNSLLCTGIIPFRMN